MFMTLKATGGGKKNSGMEQITSTEAGQGGPQRRYGANRRLSCVNCQTKKLRCTGNRESCDKCKNYGILCVMPPSSKTREKRATRAGNLTPSERSAANENHKQGIMDVNHNQLPPHVSGSLPSPADGGDFETAPHLHDWTIDAVESNHELLALDPLGLAGFSTPQSTDSGQRIPFNSSVPVTPQTEPRSISDTSVKSKCSCLDDLLGIIQKLDDDEFRLRTLAFDQVLKLQKYLLFHCLAPLNCSGCSTLSRSHTIVLIICERVTEMFCCLSKRLRNIAPNPVPENRPSIADPPGASAGPSFFSFKKPFNEIIGWGTAQMFDGETGEAVITVNCNPEMFSPDFREQYSAEEQFHMIHALARVQVKNFSQLLLRVGAMPQSESSQARLGKIQSLSRRLHDSGRVISESFENLMASTEV